MKLLKLLLLLIPAGLFAQSIPIGPISQGQVWTPAQWNTAWQSKADVASAVPQIATGNILCNASGITAYPAACAVLPSLSNLPQIATGTVLGNSSGSTAAPSAVTALPSIAYPSANIFPAQAYGQTGLGTTPCAWTTIGDVGPCINSAITAAATAGGGSVIIPATSTYYGLATTILNPNNDVNLLGQGFGQTQADSTGPRLVWTGAKNATMYYGGSATAANVSGQSVWGVQFDCANIAGTGMWAQQVSVSQFWVSGIDCRTNNLLWNTGTGGAPGSQHNDIWAYSRANPTSVATFTGSISGNTLTVTAISAGTIEVGQVLVWTGMPINLSVSSLGTGTGGIGTYILSQVVNGAITTPSVTLASQTIKGYWAGTGVLFDRISPTDPSNGNFSLNHIHEVLANYVYGDGVQFGGQDNNIVDNIESHHGTSATGALPIVVASQGYVGPNLRAIGGPSEGFDVFLDNHAAIIVQGSQTGAVLTATNITGAEAPGPVSLTTTAAATQYTSVLTYASTTGVSAGEVINCPVGYQTSGISPNDQVASVTGTTITLGQPIANTTPASLTCTFSYGFTNTTQNGAYYLGYWTAVPTSGVFGDSITASISGTVMTVTACTSCTLNRQQKVITGAGVTGTTLINSQLTGPPGGVGTYNLNLNNGTIASEAMTWSGCSIVPGWCLQAPFSGKTQSGIANSSLLTFQDLVFPTNGGAPNTGDYWTITASYGSPSLQSLGVDHGNQVPQTFFENGSGGTTAWTGGQPIHFDSLVTSDGGNQGVYLCNGFSNPACVRPTVVGTVLLGDAASPTGVESMVAGLGAKDRGRTAVSCWSSGNFSVPGDAETCTQIFRGSGPAGNGGAATPLVLTSDGLPAGAINCINMPISSIASLTIDVTSFDVTATTTTLTSATWNVWTGSMVRKSGGTTILTMNTTPNPVTTGTTTGVALSASATGGCLSISFTPPTAGTDTWRATAKVTAVEMTL